MVTTTRTVVALAATAFAATVLFASAPRAQNAPASTAGPSPASTTPAAPRAPAAAPRFDEIVRADFFAGFLGDAARLARGMQRCEEALAADPGNADALVWHGSGLMFLAGEASARQDFQTAGERARRGREEMDRAARLAPDSLSVMLIRAVTLSASAPNVRDRAQAQVMQQSAVDAFERALVIQTPDLPRMSEHSRGELLAGLAEGWSRLGNAEKSRGYLERIVQELPDTRYAARATAWLEDGPQSGPLTCLTCHRP